MTPREIYRPHFPWFKSFLQCPRDGIVTYQEAWVKWTGVRVQFLVDCITLGIWAAPVSQKPFHCLKGWLGLVDCCWFPCCKGHRAVTQNCCISRVSSWVLFDRTKYVFKKPTNQPKVKKKKKPKQQKKEEGKILAVTNNLMLTPVWKLFTCFSGAVLQRWNNLSPQQL